MPYRKFVWPAMAAVAAVVVALIVINLGGSLTYYLTPSEAVDRRTEFPDGDRFRLGGLVVVGSLDDLGAVKVFDVTDGAETITVRLQGVAPPLFAEDVGVVVEGSWSGDEFAADLALVHHDENYQPPSTAAPG
ncbi:MAG TPA: cytochrome c maturation protein CcmE [Acidimicrobiia bacterium]|nr:cytochrome c maturation protein CcmE [Acidimicrobiia bacterium]